MSASPVSASACYDFCIPPPLPPMYLNQKPGRLNRDGRHHNARHYTSYRYHRTHRHYSTATTLVRLAFCYVDMIYEQKFRIITAP
uniref:Uncharacterized protein n=1 Tax=Helianthus annuus TaxID=4232 RepID=A0A251T8Z0_HELAN